MWVCLFDDGRRRDAAPADRAHLGHLARRAARRRGPGSATASASHGPWDPEHGLRVQPRQAAARPLRPRDRRRARVDDPADARLRPRRRPARAATPRLRAVRPAHAWSSHDDFDWGDDRPPRHRVARHGRSTSCTSRASPRCTPGARGAARHVRRAGAPGGRSTTSRDLGVTAVELLPVHQFVTEPAPGRARAGELLGLQLARLLRPARGLRARRATAAQQVAEFKQMVQGAARGRARGDPRRRLQPHRRGRPGRADAASAASTTSATTSCAGDRGAPTSTSPAAATPSTSANRDGAAADPRLAALLGHRDARRRLPLRPGARRWPAPATTSTCAAPSSPRSARTRCCGT